MSIYINPGQSLDATDRISLMFANIMRNLSPLHDLGQLEIRYKYVPFFRVHGKEIGPFVLQRERQEKRGC
jgi:hypothetical protein